MGGGGVVNMKTLLESRRAMIMERWLEQAEREPAAEGLSGQEVRDSLEPYLGTLVEQLDELDAERLTDLHVSARIRQGFQLHEIVHEYTYLSECVAREWSSLPPEERELAEIERFFRATNRAITTVVGVFTKHMIEDEQNQKRYLRLLDQLGFEALTGTPLSERLDAVVKLARRAIGADVAAICCYSAEERQFTISASTAPDEPAGCYTIPEGGTSFVARVAAIRESLEYLEQFTDDLEPDDPLFRSRARSLLGHPLRARGKLLGVLYAGLEEHRRFTPSQRRQMSSFAERLALLLDNASLFQDRQDNIDRLQAERELRERFVAILAHDLRGPLAAAKIAAQLLGRRPQLADRASLAQRVTASIDRTERMVRDLLDANRIRAGQRLPLHLQECDLTAVAREVTDELNAVAGHRVTLVADEHVRGIWSADELRRSLWNLGQNALKYGTPDGQVTFIVHRTPEGAEAMVHNFGDPIPPEAQARIFDAFLRTPKSEAGGPRGWGLGLTLVRGCAEAHGGRIEVESGPDTGTTFRLRLPPDSRVYQDQTQEQSAPALR
jgi:signal transduction histidine kinase